jgi:hypothetical protein
VATHGGGSGIAPGFGLPSPGGRIAGVAEAHPLAVLRRSIDDARIDDGESCTSAPRMAFAPDRRHAPLSSGRPSHGLGRDFARSRNMALCSSRHFADDGAARGSRLTPQAREEQTWLARWLARLRAP